MTGLAGETSLPSWIRPRSKHSEQHQHQAESEKAFIWLRTQALPRARPCPSNPVSGHGGETAPPSQLIGSQACAGPASSSALTQNRENVGKPEGGGRDTLSHTEARQDRVALGGHAHGKDGASGQPTPPHPRRTAPAGGGEQATGAMEPGARSQRPRSPCVLSAGEKK